MSLRSCFLFFVLLVWSGLLHSQNINPGVDEIYRPDEIAVLRITMSEADRAFLMDIENAYSNDYLPGDIRFTNSVLDEEVLNVGVRLRGNTSRTHPKRSFKIKFKEFGGSKFYGQKKFNLKAENNDPSLVREHLSLQTFRDSNVPAARSHHVEVYLNDEYMGLYLNVEQIDDEFALTRFGNDEGNVYKCQWGSTLEDNDQIFNNEIYEIKTNKALNDRSVLENFVDVLNNTSDELFAEEIQKVFNVNAFIRYLAVEALLGHWDGYSYNKNNFYLYENPGTGLIEFIPYDVNNTFGIDWVVRDWATRDVLDWPKHDDPRPLVSRVLSNETWLQMYVSQINALLSEHFSSAHLGPILDQYQALLSNSIERDNYYPQTFGFVHQDFLDSYNMNTLASHLPYGIKPYISLRSSEASSQIVEIEVPTESPAFLDDQFVISPNPSNGSFLQVTGFDHSDSDIHVINQLGQKIAFGILSIHNNEVILNFKNGLSPGIYLVLLNGEKKKFIVH